MPVDMALLFLLAAVLHEPVSSSLYGSRFLAGRLGGSITHQCFYSTIPANKYEGKYWCKVAANGVCYAIVSSSSSPWGEYRGRVALRDVPQNGTLTVTMTGLRSSDSGTYRCGIGGSSQGLYVSLNLTVSADATAPRPTQLIRGELHGSVTVPCPSGDTQSGQKRFWCKVGRSSCTLMASSDGYVGRSYQGRIVITPQDSSGAFRVLINDLRKEDSGLYLCGTQGPRAQDSPQEVVLQVATASALPRRPKFLSGAVGGSLSFQCHHDPRGTYEQKYLCRWKAGSCPLLLDHRGFVLESYRGRLHVSGSDPEHGSFTVLLRQLREEDEGWYWCGARSGQSELTASLKLLIRKGTCSSRDPGTATPLRATAPSPAAHSTARHGSAADVMGTVPRDTKMGTATYGITMGTVPRDTKMGTATQGITMGTVPRDTKMGTVPRDTTIVTVPRDTKMGTVTYGITMGTVPRDTRMGTVPRDTTIVTVPRGTTIVTVTQGSSSLLPTATSASPGASATAAGEAFQESSSGEPRLLPVVLPALLLLISITITALALAKIKLQKQAGKLARQHLLGLQRLCCKGSACGVQGLDVTRGISPSARHVSVLRPQDAAGAAGKVLEELFGFVSNALEPKANEGKGSPEALLKARLSFCVYGGSVALQVIENPGGRDRCAVSGFTPGSFWGQIRLIPRKDGPKKSLLITDWQRYSHLSQSRP